MFIIFTGNGKGKTTAAIGQALRAIGNGSCVLMVEFIKGPWLSGEDESAKGLSPHFKIVKMGRGFVHESNTKISFAEHVEAAKHALLYAAKEALTKKWDILILDEVWNALDLNLLTPKMICSFITAARPYVDHIIMTGRNCPKEFIDLADLVTEMKEVKHPFNSGVSAQKGVEF